jgi:hypothetical protein
LIAVDWLDPLRSLFKKKVLTFKQNDLFCTWGTGPINHRTITYVMGRWRVTNNSDRDVTLTKVRLSKYASHDVQLSMRNPEDERNMLVLGGYPIAPHQTSEVQVIFNIFPSLNRPRIPIIDDVIFTDKDGNSHPVRSRFAYGLPKPASWFRRIKSMLRPKHP